MSIFDQEDETVTIETLVGEGKKYSDPDALARSRIEADKHIERLENELNDMRTELRSRTSIEELLEKRDPPKADPPVSEIRNDPQEPSQKEPEVDLSERVRQLLEEERSKETKTSNISKVRAGLKERYGADYNQTLRDIATDLEVSEQFLSSLAESSPNGFFNMIDKVRPSDDNRPLTPPKSSVDTTRSPFGAPTRRNKAYYEELRKTDINTYFSKKVQNEMYKDAMAQGAKFYE